MNNQSLLTFFLHGLLLAVDTRVVREIIWLPELTLIEECPRYVAGVINMHGKIVPVVDLNSRFGHPPQRYGCSDRVIVLDLAAAAPEYSGGLPEQAEPRTRINLLGIIVNEVLDVLMVPEENIEPPPFAGGESRPHVRFISGEAKAGDDLLMLLDPWRIIESEAGLEAAEGEEPEPIHLSASSYFCPEADRHEKEIFHGRALQLRPVPANDDSVKLIAVAVVSLNGEFLCLELGAVREFAKINNFTPVPCCPRHIAGNMNLRGNVLTVVDIRGLLNMPEGKIGEATKVVVADPGKFAVGLLVDEIVDVINLREAEIVAVPASLRVLNEKFVKGAVPFAGRVAALLDLPAILAWDGLIVNEEV